MLFPTKRAMQGLERAIEEEPENGRNWRDIALSFFEAGAVALGYMREKGNAQDV